VRRFADQAILRPNAQEDWLQRRVAAAGDSDRLYTRIPRSRAWTGAWNAQASRLVAGMQPSTSSADRFVSEHNDERRH
jgi:hypothetical protein